MSEKERPFTVNDRRHFTPEGRAREDQAREDRPADVRPALAGAGLAHAGFDRPEPAGPATAVEGRDESLRPAVGEAPVDLASFLLSLGAQASLLLSAPEADAPPAEALGGARQIISILEMLRDKTEGRRTDAESQVLDGLLFQLRLAYVERAKRP